MKYQYREHYKPDEASNPFAGVFLAALIGVVLAYVLSGVLI
jgi:hypothetical protein